MDQSRTATSKENTGTKTINKEKQEWFYKTQCLLPVPDLTSSCVFLDKLIEFVVVNRFCLQIKNGNQSLLLEKLKFSIL